MGEAGKVERQRRGLGVRPATIVANVTLGQRRQRSGQNSQAVLPGRCPSRGIEIPARRQEQVSALFHVLPQERNLRRRWSRNTADDQQAGVGKHLAA